MRRLRSAAAAVLRRPARAHPLLGRRLDLRHQGRAARRLRLRPRRHDHVLRRRRAADAPGASRPSARLRRRHRSLRVLRRGRRLHPSGFAGVRHPHVQDPPPVRAARPPVRRHRPVALPGRHRQSAAVAALLHHAGCRLRRRRGVGLAGDAGRRRGGVRPQRRLPLHQLHRLRAHAQPRRPPPAPQRHLPQRPRAAVRLQPARDRRRRRAAGAVDARSRTTASTPASAARRSSSRTTPTSATACSSSIPADADRGAAPPGPRAAGRDLPEQGRLRVPLRPPRRPRRRHRGRALHLRADQGFGRGAGPEAAADRRVPGAQPGAQHASPTACSSRRRSASTRSASASSPAPTRTTPLPATPRSPGTRARTATTTRPRSGRSRAITQQPRRPRGGVGGGELARRALHRAAPARDLRHQRHAAGGALLRRRASPTSPAARPTSSPAPTRPARRWAASSAPCAAATARASPCSRSRIPAREDLPGTDLQRIQIVKTWLENGQPRERVYDVAGDANNGADVDPATCAPRGAGAAELCAVWEDPDFNPDQRALYYARVLENPTCRWSTFVCKHGRRRSAVARLRRAGGGRRPGVRRLLPRRGQRPLPLAAGPGARLDVAGLVPQGRHRLGAPAASTSAAAPTATPSISRSDWRRRRRASISTRPQRRSRSSTTTRSTAPTLRRQRRTGDDGSLTTEVVASKASTSPRLTGSTTR